MNYVGKQQNSVKHTKLYWSVYKQCPICPLLSQKIIKSVEISQSYISFYIAQMETCSFLGHPVHRASVWLSRLSLRAALSNWTTQPSIPSGSVNEDQIRLGRQRQVWFIPFIDKRVGGKVNCVIPWQRVPYLSASVMWLAHKKALYRVSSTMPNSKTFHRVVKLSLRRSLVYAMMLPCFCREHSTCRRGNFCQDHTRTRRRDPPTTLQPTHHITSHWGSRCRPWQASVSEE